jgi:hypothetical protein
MVVERHCTMGPTGRLSGGSPQASQGGQNQNHITLAGGWMQSAQLAPALAREGRNFSLDIPFHRILSRSQLIPTSCLVHKPTAITQQTNSATVFC